MRAIAAAAALVLAGALAPVASAETAVLREVAGAPGDGRQSFTDNPAIVDAQPMAAESFTRIDDRRIAVHFTTGTPACYGVHATVQETPQTVTVELLSGTLPEAVDRACIMIAVFGTIDVALQHPLGDRAVVSVY
ncbi:hypothetical protein [Mycobacterium sp. IDR2000157661]|uniref:hypothetical protein n=1 Tax=Mycobacterium sp. IDR2000157661 TaxID=2867005 RepID=UPI001EEF6955|nr:hypothetical protein [Mycobacterium sp. IDR2000157661]ULE34851.1 hypothetical protein K3G64_09840 [Mycobacterium sp. IDR2000157661]